MQKFIYYFLLLLFINQHVNAQVIDSAPTGKMNILPVEGGAYKMKIDSTTALADLIDKLNDNWGFIETGKGYWIGYTNDMFSIAARGDEAIPALINFFNRTKIEKGKIGAIYTLHLIGINRQIIGRFEEKFTNPKARMALLGLLKEKNYAYTIASLLMRDPWKFDIPYFFQLLQSETNDEIAWPVINCLRRYITTGLPINSQLPDSLGSLSIQLNVKNENVLENNFDFNKQIKEALKKFGDKYPESIKIEKKLYTETLSKYYRIKLSSSLNIYGLLSSLGIGVKDAFSYVEIGCKIQYYVQEGKLYFCTIKTAQERLNIWWSNLSVEEKGNFK